MSDYISRQAAISAICNACGKIDCDKMDKCEKLQLPPANCSEFPNSSDTISRQQAIEALDKRFDSIPMEQTSEILMLRKDLRNLPPAQPEQLGTNLAEVGTDCISRQAIDKFIDGLEEIFADLREQHVDDSVCGLCEYDGAYIGQSGDWCNECPGFDKDDCFKLSDKTRKEWTEEIIKALPPSQPEPCEDDPRADVYYLAEKIGIHQLYALVVQLRGEPEPCEDAVSRKDCLKALSNMMDTDGFRNGWAVSRANVECMLKAMPPVTPKQRTDTLKAEIKRMKRSFTTCINSDYYTGYMSALSAVEGYIAQWEGANNDT